MIGHIHACFELNLYHCLGCDERFQRVDKRAKHWRDSKDCDIRDGQIRVPKGSEEEILMARRRSNVQVRKAAAVIMNA